ncbi:hypothetical protein SAMN05421780_101536 [Flexibacter flexilis DSM 6793]|uniref:Uncharacterized protein n=1 Tax=Flexibacter flexilis DSM 6793 TaxID=927664 RepID=A0A1I1DY65_9BACT|nr:hypothetical protein [Flexibacter flexilis]SFB79999.1 hypothetical protein SAMN05421780_101536 [Flexibacter flexilis DSM 6793]
MIVTEGQSVIDAHLQTHGDLNTVVQFCANNGITPTSLLLAGQVLQPLESVEDSSVTDYYAARTFRVNSGSAMQSVIEPMNDFDSQDFDSQDFY